jgi:hypothetical protein
MPLLATGTWDSPQSITRQVLRQPERCVCTGGGTIYFAKSSGANDAVHHINCAYDQRRRSAPHLGLYLQLVDNNVGQCCIVFRTDGAIL